MKLIADSGSSKTAWYLMDAGGECEKECLLHTSGINPVRDDEAAIRMILNDLSAQLEANSYLSDESLAALGGVVSGIDEVYFYGAGCIPSKIPIMQSLLAGLFPNARISVASDLLGAARALCGRSEGIACILGTGSNSCLYDGCEIAQNVPALGWILGDEGSGAVLGRTLVSDLFKGQLPTAMCQAFLQRFKLTPDEIIQAVYRGPQPNRLLASFVPFIVEHRSEEHIHAMLLSAFRRFFIRNVASYGRADLPVGFVGGIAAQFECELGEAASLEGFKLGTILQQPIIEMVRYHRITS